MAIQANFSRIRSRALQDMLPMALSLLETMPGGALLCDAAGIVVGVNGTCRKMLRLKAREVVGRAVSEVCPGCQWQAIMRTGLPSGAHKMALDGQVIVRMELPIFADGRVVGVLVHLISKDAGIMREVLLKMPGLEDVEADSEEQAEPGPAAAPATRYTFADIKSVSRLMREAKALAARAAKVDMPVLIQGEPGTELSMFAHAVHAAGSRASKELVYVRCQGVTPELLDADLFGGDDGGQTGQQGEAAAEGTVPAVRGKYAAADGTTLFLDEACHMPAAVQARLLRTMHTHQVPVGGRRPPDVRIIASSSKDLGAMATAGEFDRELYYRLNMIRLDVPPLRARSEDIRVLAEQQLVNLNKLYANTGWHRHLTPEAMEHLLRYSWPGNLAELESVISRAYCVCEGDEIAARHLPSALQQIGQVPTEVVGQKTLQDIVAEVERRVILQALHATGQNKSRTARLLGLPRSSFYEKLTRYGLLRQDD